MATPRAPGEPRRLSLEDREGQPRSARPASRASRHWVRGNSGQLSLSSRPLPAAPRPASPRAPGRRLGFGLAARMVRGWRPGPLAPACAWAARGGAFSASPRPLFRGCSAGLGLEGKGLEHAARAAADPLRGCGAAGRGGGAAPRRDGVTAPESSVPVDVLCPDCHCGTCATNRVSAGRKRRFPPPGASTAANRTRSGGSLGDPGPPSRPQLPLPRRCGARTPLHRPQTREGAWVPGASQLPWGPVALEGGKARKRPTDPNTCKTNIACVRMPIIMTEQPENRTIASSSERAAGPGAGEGTWGTFYTARPIGDCRNRGGGV